MAASGHEPDGVIQGNPQFTRQASASKLKRRLRYFAPDCHEPVGLVPCPMLRFVDLYFCPPPISLPRVHIDCDGYRWNLNQSRLHSLAHWQAVMFRTDGPGFKQTAAEFVFYLAHRQER